MNNKRLVGIDVGIASAHTVRVLDGEGNTVAKRKAWPTVESLREIETAALPGCADGARLEVVVEPTGPAWVADRDVLHRPGPRRASGVVGQGVRSATVPVAAHQDQRHRR